MTVRRLILKNSKSLLLTNHNVAPYITVKNRDGSPPYPSFPMRYVLPSLLLTSGHPHCVVLHHLFLVSSGGTLLPLWSF
jgi:hypothetical protein